MVTWILKNLGFCDMHEQFPEDASIVSCLGMKDGYNDPEVIYEKVKYILQLLGRSRKVVVFCHAGLSRSPSMCITALAYQMKTDFMDTYFFVKDDIAPQVNPSPGLEKCCQEALELLHRRLTHKCECGAPIDKEEGRCKHCLTK